MGTSGTTELPSKVVVVTGASMGIGEAIARAWAEQGVRVVLLSRDAARAEAARARMAHPERTLALACDVRHRQEIDRVVGLALDHYGAIDVWVNNAGHGLLDSVAEADMALCRETFDTNFFGALLAMQAVVPVMRRAGSGTIINISSVAGHIALPYHAVYSATNLARTPSASGAIELMGAGIHVMTVCPGYVGAEFGAETARTERKQVRPSSIRGISPERVARAVLQGYEKRSGK